MERIEVKQIFNEEKQALIAKCSISPVPTAVLLGGQPASLIKGTPKKQFLGVS